MKRVRNRLADPATNEQAKGRADAVSLRMRGKAPMLNTLYERARKEARPKRRVFWLRQMSQVLLDAAMPVVTCREGCDACCYQGVSISEAEARTIAMETGLPMKQPAEFNMRADLKWAGVPCPMLKDGRCSIYASRPISCRTFISADKDDLLCRIVPDEPEITVPSIDTTALSRAYTIAMIGPKPMSIETLEALNIADIRDYFG